MQTFNVVLGVPRLSRPEIRSVLQQVGAFAPGELDTAVAELVDEVPMKRLLLLLDLARQGQEAGEQVPVTRWSAVIQDLA